MENLTIVEIERMLAVKDVVYWSEQLMKGLYNNPSDTVTIKKSVFNRMLLGFHNIYSQRLNDILSKNENDIT